MTNCSNLKPGDRVIYRTSYRDDNPAVKTVARTTKTQVILDNGMRFSLNGREYDAGGGWWYGARIEPYTDEVWQQYQDNLAAQQQERRAKALRSACAQFVLRDLAPDEVEALYAYLRNKGMPEAKQ